MKDAGLATAAGQVVATSQVRIDTMHLARPGKTVRTLRETLDTFGRHVLPALR